jgi:sugar lactone lactonase YvrE
LFGGVGTGSTSGSGGPIESIDFYYPYCIVGDTLGEALYMSDSFFVWKYVFSSGMTTVFAHSTTLGQGFSGDAGPPTEAQLYAPSGLWLTTSGVLYIADWGNHRIRKISNNIIMTIAGSGCDSGCSGSFSGDNGPALSSTLNHPRGVYIDTNGKLFIADLNNNRVRVVDTNNIITTFAGTNTATPFNGENIPATSANLNLPNDVKGDSLGNIYIVDQMNCIIRLVDPRGSISTLFGTPGNCGFTSGVSSRTSSINYAYGLFLDSLSTIYFTDYNSIHRSYLVASPSSQPSGQPSTRPSRQPICQPSSQPSRQPSGQPTSKPSVAVISSHLYMQLVAGTDTNGYSGSGGSATVAKIQGAGLWVSSSGVVFIAEFQKIRTVNQAGIISVFGGSDDFGNRGRDGPITSVYFQGIRSIVASKDGTVLYFSDLYYIWKYLFSTDTVTKYAHVPNAAPGFGGDFGPPTSALLNGPAGLWLTTGNVLYIADQNNHRIRKITAGDSPIITTVAGNGGGFFAGDNGPAALSSLNNPLAVFMDTTGLLYIADSSNHRIRVINQNNIITTFAGTGNTPYNGEKILALTANLNTPTDVKGGSLGNIYIADSLNAIVRVVDTNGIISTVFGKLNNHDFTAGRSPRLSGLKASGFWALWVDSQSTVYFSDFSSIHRGVVVSSPDIPPNLFMQLVAGTSSAGFGGNGGAATSAQVRAMIPWVDTNGNVYIPDQSNSRIRKVALNGIISTFAGSGTTSTTGTSGQLLTVSFNSPYSMVGDTAGTSLYISDRMFVWKYDYSSNIVSRFVGGAPGYGGDGGFAISGRLTDPMGLWLTSDNVLYIADAGNHRIRKVTVSGIISTVAGYGEAAYYSGNDYATSSALNSPRAVFVDVNGRVFIADTGNNRIRMVYEIWLITFAGSGTPFAYNGYQLPLLSTANLNGPTDVKGDSLGNIYFAEGGGCLIRMADITGIVSELFGSSSSCGYSSGLSSRLSPLNNVVGMWVDSLGVLYFGDNNSVHKGFIISPTAQPSGEPSTQPSVQPTSKPSSQPSRLPSGQPTRLPTRQPTAQPSSQPSRQPSRQPTRSPTGQPSRQPSCQPSAQPTSQPSLARISPRLYMQLVAGTSTSGFSGNNGLATLAQINARSLWVSPSGIIYFPETESFGIRKITPGGIVSAFGGTGSQSSTGTDGAIGSVSFYQPYSIIGDREETVLYISDQRYVWKYSFSSNIVSVYAHTPGAAPGFAGDGSAASSALLNSVYGLWLTTSDMLYIADGGKIELEK